MSVISNCTYKRHEFLNQSLHLLNCTKKLPLKQLQKITLNSVIKITLLSKNSYKNYIGKQLMKGNNFLLDSKEMIVRKLIEN